jgi:hypothetical protein
MALILAVSTSSAKNERIDRAHENLVWTHLGKEDPWSQSSMLNEGVEYWHDQYAWRKPERAMPIFTRYRLS